MMSLSVPLVLLLLVRHAAGEEHLVPVVTLRAGRVLLNTDLAQFRNIFKQT